jgi:Na+-driven multidrug efflux pump
MVGTNVGAGNRERALRIAWIGAGIAALLTEIIGVAAAIWPAAWLRLFDSDPAMLETGAAYLRAVGPFYGCFGFGLALYFASQGAGKLMWPLMAGFARMAVAIGGGWLTLKLTGSLPLMFLAVGAALVIYGAGIAAAVKLGVWFPRSRSAPSP